MLKVAREVSPHKLLEDLAVMFTVGVYLFAYTVLLPIRVLAVCIGYMSNERDAIFT